MRFHFFAKTWPALLLFLFATSSWATAYNVTVGGSSGGEYGGGAVLMFSPSTLNIQVGDTVTFTNAGGTHNVDADGGAFRCARGCDGAGGDGSPSDDSWASTVTFNEAGAFPYHCEVHGSMGMTGVINVAGGGTPTNVPITAGFTGAWFDPNQSGHGILIEVLSDTQILAWWFTFNPDGTQQAWFGNVGAINGTTATIDALQTQGGRWIPNFDPGNITQPSWGTLTFTFTDCSHGRVDFSSTMPGYASGHMDITRLTQPAGTSCP